MNIGIYTRVSHKSQVEKGLSIDDQIRRGIEYCEKNNYTYEVYKDEGLSGNLSIEDRPELKKLFDKILNKKKKEIDGVFITDIDRLTRNENVGLLIYSYLIEREIKLFDLNGEINLNDGTTSLIVKFKILLGSFERKKVQERVKRNLETSVIKGRVGGGPLLNYGYKKGEHKLLTIDEEESKIIQMIYQYCLDGEGTKRISTILNEKGIPTKRMKEIQEGNIKNGTMKVRGQDKTKFIWRDSVIHRILTNPIYKGERRFSGKTYDSPIIISPEIFDSVQLILSKRNYFKNTTNKFFYLLKGLLICKNCGSRMLGKKRLDLSDNHYSCSSKRYKEDNCKSRSINIDILNDLVWETTKNLSVDYLKLMEKKNDNKVNNDSGGTEIVIKMCDESINELTKKYHRTISLFNDEELGYKLTQDNLNNIKLEIEKLEKLKEKKLNEFENLSVEKDFYKVLNKYCKDIRLVRNDEKKQKILQSIIDRIDVIWLDEYKRHFVEIKYKFDEVNNFLLNRQLNVKYKPNGNSFKLLGTEKIKFEIQYNNFNKRNEDLKGNDFKSSLVYEG